VGRWLAKYLESKNYTVELQEVLPKRFNVFAYKGKNRKTPLLVSSHIDTVRSNTLHIQKTRRANYATN
jgi:acetylornithine deacetylase